MKNQLKVFIISSQSVTWSPMSAKSGRSNIKPIFNFLPHVAENFVVLSFPTPQALLIRDLRSCSVAGCGGNAGAVLQETSQRKSIGVKSGDFGSGTPFPARKPFYRTDERNCA